MKYILLILLFFACKAQGQITTPGIFGSSSSSADATSYSYVSVNYVSSKTYLLVVYISNAANDGEVTVSSNTWDYIASTGDLTRRIVMFYCSNPSTLTETIEYGNFGSTGQNCRMIVYELNGAIRNATPTVQEISGSGSGANPSITMAAIGSIRNMVVAAFMNDVNPFGGTGEAGWDVRLNHGNTTPDMGSFCEDQVSPTDNTPSVTVAASNWIGLAIEIESAARRRIIID